MRITRRKLKLNSLQYSREFLVPRSAGCHLMTIVTYIARAAKFEKVYREREIDRKLDLDNFATPGFLWEAVMSRSDKLEHAFSIEAVRMYMTHRPNIVFPGEKFWCKQCDRFMTGSKVARRHIRLTGHKGIFSTPDAYDTRARAYVEWKWTKKGSKRSHPKVVNTKDGIWKWHMQVGWNCMALGTKTGKIIVLHDSGFEPEPYEITFHFRTRDLERIKEMIVVNAEDGGLI